jgi:hydrogenase expression/formation protein HypE
MPQRSLALGKIPPEILEKIVYPRIGHSNPRLLLGPGIGRDVAAVRYDRILVLTTDPVTGTTRKMGEHSVHINANDVATAGARPAWYLCTILLPPRTNQSTLSSIMKGIDLACKQLGIAVASGHTETTRGIDRPIISGFMIGELEGRLLRAEDVRVGDAVILTKTAGIEGTAILASDHSRRLGKLPRDLVRRALQLSHQISVVTEALALARIPALRVMHDPTEGGVLNACWELSVSSGLGIEIWADNIPVAQETSAICKALRLDPLKLMSSGCLLAIVPLSSVRRAMEALRKVRVKVSTIGEVSELRKGRTYLRRGRRSDLVAVPQDELYRLG